MIKNDGLELGGEGGGDDEIERVCDHDFTENVLARDAEDEPHHAERSQGGENLSPQREQAGTQV